MIQNELLSETFTGLIICINQLKIKITRLYSFIEQEIHSFFLKMRKLGIFLFVYLFSRKSF